MFQKEVALRVVAAPGDSNYGRLAILSQSVAKTRLAFLWSKAEDAAQVTQVDSQEIWSGSANLV